MLRSPVVADEVAATLRRDLALMREERLRIELDVRAVGDRIVVDVVLQSSPRSSAGVTSLKISAPKAHHLEVDTVSASITVRDVDGEQRLSSVSGSIDTEGFRTDIDLSSVSGSVVARGSERAAVTRARAISGSILLSGVAGQVDAEAVSGSVEVKARTLARATVSSISGMISVRGALANDARVDATSTSGRIDLLFDDGAAAEYDLTSFSGRITSCFGPPVIRAERSARQEQRFSEGTSNARVHANTMSGAIGLCKE